MLKRQINIMGELVRKIVRKMCDGSLHEEMKVKLTPLRKLAVRICTLIQKIHDKNKLYAMHGLGAECIAEGKARRPYKFCVRATSIAVTRYKGLVVGARAFPRKL